MSYIDGSGVSAVAVTGPDVNDRFTTREVDPALFRDGAAVLADRPVRVFRKTCCGVPRDQSCQHDLPARAFEPGCRTPIMCRPAGEWDA